LASLAAVLVVAAAAAEKRASPKASDTTFQRTVQPFLKEYCFDCHSGSAPEGEVGLDAYGSPKEVLAGRDAWEHVRRMLQSREMPPEDMPQPMPADSKAVVEWIERTLYDVDGSGPINPGRVTIRRLNRVEYANTIRDLLGVAFDANEHLPADDVGYGFDTIGDVLSFPPLLMEKYLDAAERIAAEAIVADPREAVAVKRYEASDTSSTLDGAERGGFRGLYSRGEAFAKHRFPRDGEYLFRVEAYGQQAGSEPARMALRLDDRQVKVFDVEAVESEPAVYEYRGKAPAGERRVGAEFLNDYYKPDAANPNERDRNLYVGTIEVTGPLGLKPEDYPESHRRVFAEMRGTKPAGREAARRVLRRLAERAYRRPAKDGDLEKLVLLFQLATDEGESFERGIRAALMGILVSPHFLFRVERDPPADGPSGVRLLDEFELATRISYFLWSSMPDEELFRHARAGTLRENLDRQVRRMLADPKAEALVENFAGQWLQLRNLDVVTPDKGLFPSFDDELRAAMRQETEMFFATLMADDRSVTELIDADFTFLNERLARHYGVDGVRGDRFRRVSLEGSPRGGVITQASVLTVTSNPTRTSPVKRGKWIMETILGTPPPEPPPDVPMLDESNEAILSGSLRERMELHRRKETCAVCHRKMDALGFAMENFDAVGAWRTHDGEFPVDASGTLPDGQSFNGPAELKGVLREGSRDDFVACLAEKMLIYGLGRGLEYYDKRAVNRITAALAENDYRFSTLVLEIVKSDPFQKRSAAR
jgi:hypothetical protein